LVTIVLPIYNQADFMPDALEAILSQTYRDFELVIVDDGSTDANVGAVLSRYAGDPRIMIIHQSNQKLPRALNNGFARARGEFYTWTSSDNIMLPNQLERLVAYLRAHPDLAMVYSDYLAIDSAGRPLDEPSFRPQNQDPRDRSIMRLPHEVTEANFHDSGDNFIGASFMYRRDAAWFIGEYAVDAFGGEDYDYWLRMNNFFEIGHLPEVLYKYRVHANSLNARAVELEIFERVRKVLRRDAKLRAYLRKHQAMVAVTHDEIATRLKRNGVRVYAYSASADAARRKIAALFRTPFDVCHIDVAPEELDMAQLRRADLIATTDAGCFAELSRSFRTKVICLDIGKQPALLNVLTLYRKFQKACVGGMTS
jgi:glycosyltransferase involved in cell wall biosynthesis